MVPFLGPSGGTKNETAKSQNPQKRPTRATNKKLQLRLFKQPAYRVGTEEARTCEAWFHLTFRPQKWNLKAHMWYQLSPFPSSNAAICDAAPPRQHSPILRYSSLLRYSVLCFNSITQCNWHFFFLPEPGAFRRVYGTWDLLVYHVTIAAPYPGGIDPRLAVYARSCDGHFTTTRRDRLTQCNWHDIETMAE